MTPEIRRFFDELAPMLMSRRSALEVEAELGASASGTAAFGFYAELVTRNLHKIMRDVFPGLRAHVSREGASRWPGLVEGYRADHPPTGADPNAFAAHFPAWLGARGHGAWAEIADFEWLRVLTHHAPDDGVDGDSDGFDRRLFVRQYSFDVPAFVTTLAGDHGAAVPDPRATVVIVFRDPIIGRVRVFYPGAAGLAVLARRRGLPLPPALRMLGGDTIDGAEHELVRLGVLFASRIQPDREGIDLP